MARSTAIVTLRTTDGSHARRSRRLLVTAGGLLCAVLFPSSPAYGASESSIAALRAAPCPPAYAVLHPEVPESAVQEMALDGYFRITGRVTHIAPPVDWTQNPEGSKAFEAKLNNLTFLNALFSIYNQNDRDPSQRRDALAQARDIVLDWIASEPLGGPNTGNEAWGDKVSGDRAPYVGYLTRAAACENLLTDAEASILLDSLETHGRFLSEEVKYKPTNHGLFVDLGLMLLASHVPFFDQSEQWDEFARHRFEDTLRGRMSWEEGIWLEHSPGYQFLLLKVVETFVRHTDTNRQELADLLDRMREAGGWFTMPDGAVPQFGDTRLEQAPVDVQERARDDQGLTTYDRAGYAVVKEPQTGSYLAVASSFHNMSHKDRDELTFDLYERGHRVVSDTGIYHKDPDGYRAFQRSPQAHTTLTADGQPFKLRDNEYGSGILATGVGDGWYAILGDNPLLHVQGVDHRRLLLYRPGELLVALDRLRSAERHEYRRYVQLGPDVRTDRQGADLALEATGLRAGLFDDESELSSDRSVVRGEQDPLGGLTFPSFREAVPRKTFTYRSRAHDAEHALTFDLEAAKETRARALRSTKTESRVLLETPGAADRRLKIDRSGAELAISDELAR